MYRVALYVRKLRAATIPSQVIGFLCETNHKTVCDRDHDVDGKAML